MEINIENNTFIKIENKPTVIDEFNEQDKFILQKVKSTNKYKAKDIIADYGLSHPLKPIFTTYKNNYDQMILALEKFAVKRFKDLLELTKDL
jgi:hypothetical protein